MVLTQGWVNAVSIGIVVAALVRLWDWPSGRKRSRACGEAQPMAAPVRDADLFVDAYLLLEHTRGNRAEISRSEMCGCVYCEQLYRPAEIAGWVEDTAVCPRCERKTVVGSGAGIRLTRELLRRSHAVGDEPSGRTHSRAS